MTPRMSTRFALLLSVAVLFLSLSGGIQPTAAQSRLASSAVSPSAPLHAQGVGSTRHSTPVMFIENVGQFDPSVRFLVQGDTGTMWLSDDAIWITHLACDMSEHSHAGYSELDRADADRAARRCQGVNLKLSACDANAAPRIEPFDRLDVDVSYFIGSDSGQWHPAVPVWGGVRYVDLYPGIDLELTSASGQWQQRIIARPGADLGAVRLRVEGADTLAVDAAGRLRLATAIGDFTMVLFQLVTAGNSPVPMVGEKPEVTDNQIRFPFTFVPLALSKSSRKTVPSLK